VNDYPLLRKWAEEHRGQEDLVKWLDEKRLSIQPAAYIQLSQYLARHIAQMIKETRDQHDVFFVESARGAGLGIQESEGRDRYDRDLFAVFQEELGDEAHFANIELRVSDREAHQRRVEDRVGGSPWFVALKYMDEEGRIQNSVEQAQNFDMLVNESFHNDGEPELLEQFMEGLIARALLAAGEMPQLDLPVLNDERIVGKASPEL
jgi:hypothetical protein